MMELYYVGTIEQCESYNETVTIAENFTNGDIWATARETASGDYAILKACPENNCARTYTDANMNEVRNPEFPE